MTDNPDGRRPLPDDVPAEFAPPSAEPAFLPHPVLDALLEAVVALGAELWVERDRRMTLERLLAERGVLDPEALEAFRADDADRAARRAAREALVARTLGALRDLPGTDGTEQGGD